MGEKITILTYNKDIIKYCNAENINCLKFELFRPSSFKSIFKIFTLKKILDDLIEKIDFGKEDCYYQLTNVVSYDSFYLAKELSKRGTVYFKNVGVPYNIYKINFKDFIKAENAKYLIYKLLFMWCVRCMSKMILDLDLMFYETDNLPRFGVSDKFFRDNNIVKIDKNKHFNYDTLFDVSRENKTSHQKCENLIICKPTLNKSIRQLYARLLDLPLEFAFKRHPTSRTIKSDSSFYELFKGCDEIPKYMPVELFFSNVGKNVIAGASTSLVTASKFEHLNAISVLKLVKVYPESSQNEYISYLKEKSKNKILFPTSFEELRDILINK